MPLRPLMSSDTDWRDTPRGTAASVTERPAGARQSSRRISPGWGGLNISMTASVVVFEINVGGVLALDIEGQAVVSCHPCGPGSLSLALERVQFVAWQLHGFGQRPVVETGEHAPELVGERRVETL